MLAFLSASTSPFHRLFWAILLLDASLSAYNERWDNANCTEDVVSISRGSLGIMTCNISNNFRHVTIKLTTHGEKTRTIFNEMPPGHFSEDGWQLQIHGGQARLVISNTQDIHAGEYLWRLHGLQTTHMKTFLNVCEPLNEEEWGQTGSMLSTFQDSPADPQEMKSTQVPSAGRVEAITVIVVVVLVISLVGLAWYKRRHIQKFLQKQPSAPDLSPRSEIPLGAYKTLP